MSQFNADVKATMMVQEKDLPPSISEFKGQPTLVLNPGSRYPFSFGLTKAAMITSNFETIKKFVESQGKSIN